MKEQKKKRIIALLLFVGCIISGYMFLATSQGGSRSLNNIAQADSLIQAEFANFNIRYSQIQTSITQVNSSFKRKTYQVGVPYRFSKTQFHAELNSRLLPYAIRTPAKVTFPKEDMDIHLLYKGTVIRTVTMQTDPDLTYNSNQVSIVIVFKEFPNQEEINTLQQLGEPIPIVLSVENPMQANDLRKRLSDNYSQIMFWLQDESGLPLIDTDRKAAITKLKHLQQIVPEAVMLYQNTSAKTPADDKKNLITKTKMAFVDASNALKLKEQMGKALFFKELRKLQESKKHQMAVIAGNETTLDWLQQKMPDLKKAGVDIIPPPKANY